MTFNRPPWMIEKEKKRLKGGGGHSGKKCGNEI
jgi:hypothetical protein